MRNAKWTASKKCFHQLTRKQPFCNREKAMHRADDTQQHLSENCALMGTSQFCYWLSYSCGDVHTGIYKHTHLIVITYFHTTCTWQSAKQRCIHKHTIPQHIYSKLISITSFQPNLLHINIFIPENNFQTIETISNGKKYRDSSMT